jgi:hypothetical protein
MDVKDLRFTKLPLPTPASLHRRETAPLFPVDLLLSLFYSCNPLAEILWNPQVFNNQDSTTR